MEKELSFAFIGYRGDGCPSTDLFLERHRKNFELLIGEDLSRIEFLFIDDGSPNPIQPKDFFGEHFLSKHSDSISFARITQDIPWNIGGARNLSFELANAKWVYILDLDYHIKPCNIANLLQICKQAAPFFFKTSRDRPDKPIPPGCFCCRRKDYMTTYGYNEELAGTYNCGEAIMFEQLKKICKYQEYPQISLGYWNDPKSKDGSFRKVRSTSSEKSEKIGKSLDEIRNDQYVGPSKLNFNWEKILW